MINQSYAAHIRHARLQRSAALGAFIGSLAVALWRRLRPLAAPAARPEPARPRVSEQMRWAVSRHDPA
jgi:hypothetical protein